MENKDEIYTNIDPKDVEKEEKNEIKRILNLFGDLNGVRISIDEPLYVMKKYELPNRAIVGAGIKVGNGVLLSIIGEKITGEREIKPLLDKCERHPYDLWGILYIKKEKDTENNPKAIYGRIKLEEKGNWIEETIEGKCNYKSRSLEVPSEYIEALEDRETLCILLKGNEIYILGKKETLDSISCYYA